MAESCEVLHSFSCSICLDVLKNPVTLHCGHSYCMDCINGCFDQEDQSGIYSCPQCRHTFNPRPVLKKNTVLVDLMVKMSVRAQSNMRVKDEAGPGDVECDFCTVRKLKAVKSYVWHLTVPLTCNLTISLLRLRGTSWSKCQLPYKRRSAPSTTSYSKSTVAVMGSAFVSFV